MSDNETAIIVGRGGRADPGALLPDGHGPETQTKPVERFAVIELVGL